jgi:hypothetical protein
MMAGAYSTVHQPLGALPDQNMDERAALYSWIVSLLAASAQAATPSDYRHTCEPW